MQPIPPHLWTCDSSRQTCTHCNLAFSLCRRRHHCRWCGLLFCSTCTPHSIQSLRACYKCFQEYDNNQIVWCPFCSERLGEGKEESHLRECCQRVEEEGNGVSGSKMVRSVIGQGGLPGECDICMEPYLEGQGLAVLNCLCKFHERCISEWFSRGHFCPFHP